MPAKEIKELRQSGRLNEALAMAHDELSAQPNNIWCKRNIGWVYYAFLKKHVQEFNFEGFVENLLKLKALNLPEEEVMIFDTTAYQIVSMIYKLNVNDSVDYSKVNQIFDLIKEFHFTKPSESYSLLMKAFQKGAKNWSRFIEFADWWDLKNFSALDYQTEEYNGRQLSALVDKVYGSYSKKIIEGEPIDAFGVNKKVDQNKIKQFIPLLDMVIENCPGYLYLPYYKAQMLMLIGTREEVLNAFLPFAKQKKNDFWIWTLMGEIFKEDKQLEFACYCKALSLKTPNEFLIKSRQVFVKLLVEQQFYKEAKVEIKNIISVRKSKGWRIPNDIIELTESNWYVEAGDLTNNKIFYGKYLQKAEELLYHDMPEHVVAVDYVNRNKNILNFVKDKSFNGFFNYDGFISNPELGDILKVRLQPKGSEGFYKVLTAEKMKNADQLDVASIKKVSGVINIPEGKNFGFIDDVFVSPDLIGGLGLVDKQNIIVKAILSFNKSKQRWSWKAISI